MSESKPQIDPSEKKVWAAVGYLWILSLVALAARKDNEYVKFHASQGTLLFVISLPCIFIPVFGWLVNVLIGIASIVGIIKALQGEKWEMPVIGPWAKGFGKWVIKTLKL